MENTLMLSTEYRGILLNLSDIIYYEPFGINQSIIYIKNHYMDSIIVRHSVQQLDNMIDELKRKD